MQRLGLALLLLVALAVGVQQYLAHQGPASGAGGGPSRASGPAATVVGAIGGEKSGLLKDPDVRKILAERYGLTVDATPQGSIEMVQGSTQGRDFLWPSSQIALELYRQKGGKSIKADVLFNSPMVFYAYRQVTEALTRAGIVRKVGEVYYIVDAPKLVHMINAGKQWKDVGLPQLYGRITVKSTDPTRSNSGNMFAGLLANLMNGGDVVDDTSVKKVLPDVKQFFARLGYMQGTSSELFNQFLQQGVGSYPMIAGYESQLIEFSLENAQYRDLLRKEITPLYPRPTVWSSHPLIALTEGGNRLLTALQDKEIQRLAWEHHGFRSGLIGVQNSTKVLQVAGVPETIENVIPMPSARVMDRIMKAVGGK